MSEEVAILQLKGRLLSQVKQIREGYLPEYLGRRENIQLLRYNLVDQKHFAESELEEIKTHILVHSAIESQMLELTYQAVQSRRRLLIVFSPQEFALEFGQLLKLKAWLEVCRDIRLKDSAALALFDRAEKMWEDGKLTWIEIMGRESQDKIHQWMDEWFKDRAEIQQELDILEHDKIFYRLMEDI